MPQIDILMAAYNGEKYIAEQIDSILAQTFQDFRLIIRDDGSSDNTPAIIADYARKYPGKVEAVHDDVMCRSATRNFFQLLTYARADYVMFSDQDDVWLPEKIQVTYERMRQTEADNPGKPVLAFTGQKVVDAELKSLGKTYGVNTPQSRYSLRELIFCNCAPGCTQMLNRKLVEIVDAEDQKVREHVGLHDWWGMLCARAFGAIGHVNSPTMLYRQHSHNELGAPVTQFRSILKFVMHPIKTYRASLRNFYDNGETLTFFIQKYRDKLSPEQLAIIGEHLKLFSRNRITRVMTYCRLYKAAPLLRIKFIMKLLVA